MSSSANTPSSRGKKQVIVKKPRLKQVDLDWLELHRFDLDQILYEIFMTFTPDGDEFFYYRVFERELAAEGVPPGTFDYLDVMLRAQEISVQIYNQIMHGTYFEYLIRGTIEEFIVTGEDIHILLDFEN